MAPRKLTAADLTKHAPLIKVEIPFGDEPGVVYMRPPTARQIIDFSERGKDDQFNATFDLLAGTVCDESGVLLFQNGEQVGALDMRVFQALSTVVVNLAQGKPVGDAGKGETSPMSDDSPTVSPST